MTSTTLIKQEEQSIPLHLYTISNNSSSEPQWNPDYNHGSFETFLQQPFSLCPEVPLTKVVRSIPQYGYSSSSESCESPPTFSNPFASSFVEKPLPAASTYSTSPTPPDSSAAQPRIPRPPNAFMLFRSNFLKRGIIPSYVERRQQNLSRIVGQVWNMLDPAEKAKWHDQAAIALSEHQQRNPGYKFTPAPRGSRRNKSRGQRDPNSDEAANIRDIREKYTNVIGPSPPSVRKQRQQKTQRFDTKKRISTSPLFTTFSSRAPSFPPPSMKPHHVFSIDQSPPLTPYRSMTSLPGASIPRRPSTSLGFHPPPKRNYPSYGSPDLRSSSTRPPSIPSSTPGFFDYVRARGQESSLSMSQFGSVSAPSSPPTYNRIMWTPYSTLDTFNGSNSIMPSTIYSTVNQEADLSSLIPYEPVDDANSLTTVPVADNTSSENIDSYQSVDRVDTTALTSFGFTDELLATLTPAFENIQVPLCESSGQVWFPSGCVELENWDFNVSPDDTRFSITVGNL